MVSNSSDSFAELKAKTLAFVDETMARRAQMEVKSRDDAIEKMVTIEFAHGKPLVIVSKRADGLTPEMIEAYQHTLPQHVSKIDKANQMQWVEQHDTHSILYQRIITPPLVDNRSLLMGSWIDHLDDGTRLFFQASITD